MQESNSLQSFGRLMTSLEGTSLTIEDKKLYILQTRNGKRSSAASVKISIYSSAFIQSLVFAGELKPFEKLTLKLASPDLPFFVVMITTPFAPLDP